MTGSPLACDPGGIPPEERAEHFVRAERLFAAAIERRELTDGISFRLPPDLFAEIARFMARFQPQWSPGLNPEVSQRSAA